MYKAGDIVVLDFPDVQGPKRRPSVVISTDLYHNNRPDIITGLLTTQIAAAIGPTDYALQDWASSGLRLPTAFRTFLATVPVVSNITYVGRLSERDWQGVKSCLARSLTLPT